MPEVKHRPGRNLGHACGTVFSRLRWERSGRVIGQTLPAVNQRQDLHFDALDPVDHPVRTDDQFSSPQILKFRHAAPHLREIAEHVSPPDDPIHQSFRVILLVR